MKATIINKQTGNQRALVTREDIEKAQSFARVHLEKVIMQKGWGTFTSRHEALGVLRLEYIELEEAMQEGKAEKINHELGDIISACLFTLACNDTMDW